MTTLTTEQKTDLIAQIADKFPWKQTGNWATIRFDDTNINTALADKALDAKLIAPSYAPNGGQDHLYAVIDPELEQAVKEIKGVNATAADNNEQIITLKTRPYTAIEEVRRSESMSKLRLGI